MTYTGEVEVGGPADIREIDGLTLAKVAVGPMNNNAYLLRDNATGQGLLIDAAAEAGTLLRLIGDTPVATIVTTHQHPDHWGALAEVKAATGAATVAHPLDAPGIPVPSDDLVDDDGVIALGDSSLLAIHLVGHTPGSIALLLRGSDRPHLFTGDCLFPGGVGNTQQDAGRFTSLLNGVQAKLFDRLPDETWVYPGHGNDTTLGAERPHLEEWRARGWLDASVLLRLTRRCPRLRGLDVIGNRVASIFGAARRCRRQGIRADPDIGHEHQAGNPHASPQPTALPPAPEPGAPGDQHWNRQHQPHRYRHQLGAQEHIVRPWPAKPCRKAGTGDGDRLQGPEEVDRFRVITRTNLGVTGEIRQMRGGPRYLCLPCGTVPRRSWEDNNEVIVELVTPTKTATFSELNSMTITPVESAGFGRVSAAESRCRRRISREFCGD